MNRTDTLKNRNTEREREYGRSEPFADLSWEEDLMASHRRTSQRRQPVNLSSKIEDYIRSYM
jgi:hypothetical protein